MLPCYNALISIKVKVRMAKILKIKKIKTPLKAGKKRKVEFRLKINLWKVLIATFLVIIFLPFILSIFSLRGVDTTVDTSQALLDIKEGKVQEIMVQNEK